MDFIGYGRVFDVESDSCNNVKWLKYVMYPDVHDRRKDFNS